MRRNRATSLVLLGTLLLAGCGQPALTGALGTVNAELEAMSRPALGGKAYNGFTIAPQLPASSGKRAAVKLTYLMNDDTAHQSPQSLGMLQMIDDLPQKNVHNVVFRDGGEMGDSRLYYIEKGDTNQKAIANPESLLAPGVKEVQSNNPRVFSQVVEYAFDRYEGSRKYLQIYTHGGGVFGIGTDEKQTDLKGAVLGDPEKINVMPVPAFAEALRQGLKGRQLDMIYFRACLMGNVEALYELRGIARYAIASEDVSYSVDNSNLTMTKQFDDLASAGTEPAEIATQMAIQANAKHPDGKNHDRDWMGYTTMAAIEIGKLDELKGAINRLSLALVAAMPAQRDAIQAAYDAVPTIQGKPATTGTMDQQRDLYAFTAQLQQKVSDKAVLAAVDGVRAAQRAAMLHERDTFGSASNGLSILMPRRDLLTAGSSFTKFVNGRYQETRFAKDSAWDDFLRVINAGGANK